MLTFLPFVRAVKAPAQELLVCALILGSSASCAAGRTTVFSGEPSAEPLARVVVARKSPVDAPSTPAQASTSRAPSEQQPAVPGQPEPDPIALTLEVPYLSDARPLAADPRLPALDDTELARWNAGGSAEPTTPFAQPSFHPGTRVTVDTRLAKRRASAPVIPAPRGLTLERVQAQTRSRGYWPFRTCFENAQRERPGNGGETRIAFTIGTRGKVRAARLLNSELKSAAGEACLVRELLKLEFTPPPPRVLAMVATVALWPGDAPLSALPSTVDAPPVTAPGSDFDALQVWARLDALMPQLRECFAAARDHDPSLWGRLALAVTLEVDGSVHRVVEAESRFPNVSVTRCVEALIASVAFPSVNGKPFTFVAPLRLARGLMLSTSPANAPGSLTDRGAPNAN